MTYSTEADRIAGRKASIDRWRAKNPGYQARWAAEARRKAKQEMIDAYGGACTCCGEDNPVFLTVEHIGGRTGVESTNGMNEIRRLKSLGWPDTATVLCFNCNIGAYQNGGRCPHDES